MHIFDSQEFVKEMTSKNTARFSIFFSFKTMTKINLIMKWKSNTIMTSHKNAWSPVRTTK